MKNEYGPGNGLYMSFGDVMRPVAQSEKMPVDLGIVLILFVTYWLLSPNVIEKSPSLADVLVIAD